MNGRQSLRGDLIVAGYATVLFAAVLLAPTLIDPLAYRAATGSGYPSPWEELPHYPLGPWVVLLSPVAATVCILSRLFSVRGRFRTDLAVTALTFAGLAAFILAVGANFRFSMTYITSGVLFSGVLAIIQGLRYHRFDFGFTKDADTPVPCRIERLKCLYDKWARSLIWFLGFAALVCVSEALRVTRDIADLFGPKAARYLQIELGVKLLVIVPGLAFGVIWPVFQKLSSVGDAFTEIRETAP